MKVFYMPLLITVMFLAACARQTPIRSCAEPASAEQMVYVYIYGGSDDYTVNLKLKLPDGFSLSGTQTQLAEEAVILLGKGIHVFSVRLASFDLGLLGNRAKMQLETGARVLHLHYPTIDTPRYALDEPFYFQDVDFDGEMEFLVTGSYGRDAKYEVYDIGESGLKRKDYGPFARFNCFTKIDPDKQTIRLFELLGGGFYTTAQFSREDVSFTGEETVVRCSSKSSAETIMRDYCKGDGSDFKLDWIRTYTPDRDMEEQNWP